MKLHPIAAVASFLSLVSSGFGADVAVTWDASQTPATLGPLAVTYEGGKVSQLAFSAATADTVVISGDDMSFAAGARITFAGAGKVKFLIGASGEGGLTLDAPGHDIAASDVGAASATFTKPVALVGALTLTNGTEAVAHGAQGFFTDGVAVTNALALWGGRLVLVNRGELDFKEPISGKEGMLWAKVDPSAFTPEPTYRFYNASAASGKEYDLWDSDWHVFVYNVRLSAVTNIASRLKNNGLDAGQTTTIFRYTNDGTNASCEVQNYAALTDDNNKPGLVRAATLELRQNGVNIEIRTPRGYFKRNVERADFNAGNVTYEDCAYSLRPGKQSQTGAGSYVPTLIDIFCDTTVPGFLGPTSLTFSNTNSCERGSIQAGVPQDAYGTYTLNVRNLKGAPPNGFVDVYGAGSVLTLRCAGDSTSGIAYSTTMRMHDGSLFRAWENAFQLGAKGPKLELYDGSRAQLGADVQYLNHLMLANGSVSEAPLLFCGFSQDAFWTVRGESPSVVTASTIRIASEAVRGTWTLDVADVTGDAGVDFALNVVIQRYSGTAPNPDARIVKSGAGTMSLEKSVDPKIEKITLQEGFIRLLTASVTSSSNTNFIFAGGGLEIPAGIAASLGAVKLTGDSTIRLESGATIALGDQTAASWTSGTLSFVGPEPADPENPVCTNVRIGTSASAVTPAQRAHLRYNGKRVRLTDAGYLEIYEKGMMLMFR